MSLHKSFKPLLLEGEAMPCAVKGFSEAGTQLVSQSVRESVSQSVDASVCVRVREWHRRGRRQVDGLVGKLTAATRGIAQARYVTYAQKGTPMPGVSLMAKPSC